MARTPVLLLCYKNEASINTRGKSLKLPEPEDISIVIPVYNHETTVTEAIESVVMQQMPYTSVIYCMNDASSDRSAEILNRYAATYPGQVKVYTNSKNLGSARKTILHHNPPVRGRYWCLLEGDDFWTSRVKLAKQIAFLDSHPDHVGCSCNTVVKNELTGEETVIQPDRNTWNLLDLLLLKRRYAFYVHTSGIVWRNIYIESGFYPPSFKKNIYGDVMLMHAMLAEGGKVCNIPETMSCYRVTGRGIWSRQSAKEQADANNRLEKDISRAISLKYKVYASLQGLRHCSARLRNLIPGPVNE